MAVDPRSILDRSDKSASARRLFACAKCRGPQDSGRGEMYERSHHHAGLARPRTDDPRDPARWAADLGVHRGERLSGARSEEHTSELQSLMRISYAVFCLKKKNKKNREPCYTQ